MRDGPGRRGAGRLAGGRARRRHTSGATGPTTTPEDERRSLRAAGRPRARRGNGPDYDDAPLGELGQRPDYGDYGYERRDDLFSRRRRGRAVCRAAQPRSARTPFPRALPRGVRVTLDWVLTIAGAILIVLAIKHMDRQPVPDPVVVDGAVLSIARRARGAGAGVLQRPCARLRRICLRFSRIRRAATWSSSTRFLRLRRPRRAAKTGTFVKRVIGLPGETVQG